jgi:hypothetical protein
MMMHLQRAEYTSSGIFGTMVDSDDSFLLQTLEHAYPMSPDPVTISTSYLPKVPAGQYTCVRGVHSLSNGIPFETFEVTNVPGHTGILFHPGNTEEDSEGCILLGTTKVGNMIFQSRDAFAIFMETLEMIQSFEIIIT